MEIRLSRRERQILREAAAKFNVLPRDGISRLVELGYLTPQKKKKTIRA